MQRLIPTNTNVQRDADGDVSDANGFDADGFDADEQNVVADADADTMVGNSDAL